MPIILKGKLWNKTVNKKVPDEKITKQIIEKEIVETPSNYHEEHHGELHKLFNKKSDYLRDILDLDPNK
jgi:hypothetical protein